MVCCCVRCDDEFDEATLILLMPMPNGEAADDSGGVSEPLLLPLFVFMVLVVEHDCIVELRPFGFCFSFSGITIRLG